MIKYIKSQIKNIPMILVLTVLCYGIITLADNYLFNSSEVKYDNTSSGVQAGDVQGAIDELYACASNYSAYNTRLTSAESSITTLNDQVGTVNTVSFLTDGLVRYVRFGRVCVLSISFTAPSTSQVINLANLGVPLGISSTIIRLRDEVNGNTDGNVSYYIGGNVFIGENLVAGHYYTGSCSFIT